MVSQHVVPVLYFISSFLCEIRELKLATKDDMIKLMLNYTRMRKGRTITQGDMGRQMMITGWYSVE